MSETNAHHAETKRPADEPARRTKQVYGADESRRGRLPIGRASGCGVGTGGKIPGGAPVGREVAGGRAHAEVRRIFLRQGTNNDQIEDERTRRGGRADETGGLIGGRGGVRTGKAQPPRGGASRGGRPTTGSSSSKKTGGSRNDCKAFTITTLTPKSPRPQTSTVSPP
jgi:hypothetical protein